MLAILFVLFWLISICLRRSNSVLVAVIWIHLWLESDFKIALVLMALGYLHQSRRALKHKKARGLCIILAILRLSFWGYSSITLQREISEISWNEFDSTCLQASSVSSTASCTHFSGVLVEWSGEMESVQLKAVHNYPLSFIKSLPQMITATLPLMCFIGEKYQNCKEKKSEAARLVCKYKSTSLNLDETCHLEQYARYTYNLRLRMSGNIFEKSHHLDVEVPHHLGGSIRQLQHRDVVRFVGELNFSSQNGKLEPYIHAVNVRNPS